MPIMPSHHDNKEKKEFLKKLIKRAKQEFLSLSQTKKTNCKLNLTPCNKDYKLVRSYSRKFNIYKYVDI